MKYPPATTRRTLFFLRNFRLASCRVFANGVSRFRFAFNTSLLPAPNASGVLRFMKEQ